MLLIWQVFNVVEANGGVMNLGRLTRETGVQPATLQGILDFCVRKGYLSDDVDDAAVTCASCAAANYCQLACAMVDRRPRWRRVSRPAL
jgi:hypothetical protein